MSQYYVSLTGSNSNPGTSTGAAWATLQWALDHTAGGDIITVLTGNYNQSASFIGRGGSSWGSSILVNTSGTVTFKPTSEPAQINLLILQNCHFIEFDGISFDGFNCGTVIRFHSDATNHHIRFRNCEVKNSGRFLGGMNAYDTPTNTNGLLVSGTFHEFLRCRVHDNGNGGYDHGFYGLGYNSLVEGCVIYNNSAHGIHKYSAGDDLIIRNNRIFGNGQSGFLGGIGNAGGPGIGMYGGTRNRVYNNLVYSNYESGITTHYGEIGSFIDNNTVVNNNNRGIVIQENGPMTLRNNLVIGNAGTQIFVFGSATQQNNIVTGSPSAFFVDPSSSEDADFRLLPGCPAIDAATTLADFSTDFFGNARA